MSFLLSLTFVFGCLNFENQYSIDRDGDGFSIYDGDCDDNDINITLAECTDDDNDGQNEYEGDCDDTNPFVYTGIAYQDDPNKDLCMKDVDGDGFGDQDAPEGIINGSDCDDNRDNVNPISNEICDELDNDCDEDIDEEPVDGSIFYEDQDGDGFGSNNVSLSVKLCVEQVGYVSDNTDCDDSNAQINTDGTEICDEKDNDCDGLADGEDEDVDVATGQMFYVDSDGDGFGDRNNTAYACELYEGLVDNLDDCDDENEDISPNGVEICDGIDNDCDNKIDDNDTVIGGEGSGLSIFYRDVDNDGYGNADLMIERCVGIDGYVTDNTDCDDTKFNVNLGRSEICDGIDNDCDELIDDSDDSVTETTTFYRDVDGDGFGNGEITEEKCVASEGFVEDNSDCEDENAEIHPNASEVCDEIDNDCDDLVDDDDNSVDVSIGGIDVYFDFDGDGVGVEDISEVRCSAKDRFVVDYGDCDDSEETVFVGAEELCDGLNNDCSENGDLSSLPFDEIDNDEDGFVECEVVEWKGSTTPLGGDCDDEDPLTFPGSAEMDSETLCMRDGDGDGYGDETSSVGVESGSDCDDGNDSIYPNAEEICDGLKNDCLSVQMSNEELDLDGDGFVVCDGSDWVGSEIGFEDCDDGDGSIYPNAEEFCDGVVTDCRSQWYGTGDVRYIERDIDEDGAVACEIVESGWLGEGSPISGDCDDNDPLSTAKEFDADCDGILTEYDCDDNNSLDNDCDGVAIEDDCDDSDPNSTIKAEDNDCDGILAEEDCSDELANDSDCDGIPTEEDCDDNNIDIGSNTLDADCDSILIYEDCDDNHPNLFSKEVDKDCNGFIDPKLKMSGDDVCVLYNNGNISCWGVNYSNENNPPEGVFVDFFMSDNINCGIKLNSSLECWGKFWMGEVPTPDGTFIEVSIGLHNACGIQTDGKIKCWGWYPTEYGYHSNIETTPPEGEFKRIFSNYCAVRTNNELVCWGLEQKDSNTEDLLSKGYEYYDFSYGFSNGITCGGDFGNLYDCTSTNEDLTNAYSGPFKDIDSSCIVDSNGAIQCFGSNIFYFDETLEHLPTGNDFISVSTGGYGGCGLKEDGTVHCFTLSNPEYNASNTNGISLFNPIGTLEVLTNADENCSIEESAVICDTNDDLDKDGLNDSIDCDDGDPNIGLLTNDFNCDGILDSTLSVGANHNCILQENQNVVCWGGDYDALTSPPNQKFLQVSAGWGHSCGILTNNEIKCWGDNPEGLTHFPKGEYIQVSAGNYNTCALTKEYKSICWGYISNPSNTPLISTDAGCGIRKDHSILCWEDFYSKTIGNEKPFSKVSTGDDGRACALDMDGNVECWGLYHDWTDNHGQALSPDGLFVDISSGKDHNCGILLDNSIYCWGRDDYGQSSPPSGHFISVGSGLLHSCGLRDNGEVECWGVDEGGRDHGQINVDQDLDGINIALDCNDQDASSTYIDIDFDCDGILTVDDCDDQDSKKGPQSLDNDCDGIISEEDCDDNLANDKDCDGILAIEDCDDMDSTKGLQSLDNDCDGIISEEDCDDNLSSDKDCDGIINYFDCDEYSDESNCYIKTKDSLSSSGYHACAIKDDGSLECWGEIEGLHLDLGQASEMPTGQFGDICVGLYHSCAINIDGSLECWGADDGSPNDIGQVVEDSENIFIDVSCGGWTTCALDIDNNIHCWGKDKHGQSTPPSGKFKDISAGGMHGCAIDMNGFVECWGDNRVGQGNPPQIQFLEIQVGMRNNVFHTCGITIDNDLLCWGSNYYQNIPMPYNTPTGNFVDVVVGAYMTCGLLEQGEVNCWGRTPIFPQYSENVDDVFTDIDLSCAKNTSGEIKCTSSTYFDNSHLYIDNDGDGTNFWMDCDDSNPSAVSTENDLDCDGVPFASDCDDYNAEIGDINIDGDCDGQSSVFDCDDTDATVQMNQLIDSDCNQIIEDVSIQYTESLICILNDSEDIYCKNTNINKSFTKEGPFQKIDAFHNKLCGIGNDGSVICWDEFGTEISSNNTFQHTDIATHEDGYCALVEERLYCTSFTAVPFYPALLEEFLDVQFVSLADVESETTHFDNQQIICGTTTQLDVICWSKEETIEVTQGSYEELQQNSFDFAVLQIIDIDYKLGPFGDKCYIGIDGNINCIGPYNTLIDNDFDGYPLFYDCDDTKQEIIFDVNDIDCDGIPSDVDCNDYDSMDIDCDGIHFLKDCDDHDPNSMTVFEDKDCDGIPLDIDCDDNNNAAQYTIDDLDCDGIPIDIDCDDNDISVGNIHEDNDCDGIPFDIDCDDNLHNDNDCDGIPSDIDCDDEQKDDDDCDGILNLFDCITDETTSQIFMGDKDCDGIIDDPISSNYEYTCAIRFDNSVVCWGQNQYGQSEPPDGLFIDIASGYRHTCGIRFDTTVTCWGITDGSYYDRGQVTDTPNDFFVDISAGQDHTCGIRTDGTIECWGIDDETWKDYGQVTDTPSGSFIDISAGQDHTCGIRTDGTIECWGWNNYGQSNPPTGSFIKISSGREHACGIRTDGSVTCWGNNSYDQASPPNGSFVQISAGYYHTCAIKTDNTVECWGASNTYCLDSFGYTNVCLQAQSPEGQFINITSSDYFNSYNCGLKTDGTVFCWGSYDQDLLRTDFDEDGYNIMIDCDDNNTSYGLFEEDNDCDGIPFDIDCDDNDKSLRQVNLDVDCDGYRNIDDCDPYNGNDDDCDGIINEEDLYPNNPYICLVANDFDCDGYDINEDCNDNDVRFGSIENDTDCDGLFNETDPDSNFADGDLDGIPYDEDCDDLMFGASQYDEHGNCTLAICLNENNEEILTEGQSQTNFIYGEATITLTSYEGWEQHQFAEGLSYGERNCYLDWDITGIPNVNPVGCEDCIFTFELTRTPNPFGNERVPSNVDMNDGSCSFFETWQESPPPFSYGYAEDYNGYGPVLFYDGGDGFYPWIVPSQTEYPDESSLLYDETTGHFSYSIGFEDYLYSPCE